MVAILPSSSPFTSLHTNCSLRRLVSTCHHHHHDDDDHHHRHHHHYIPGTQSTWSQQLLCRTAPQKEADQPDFLLCRSFHLTGKYFLCRFFISHFTFFKSMASLCEHKIMCMFLRPYCRRKCFFPQKLKNKTRCVAWHGKATVKIYMSGHSLPSLWEFAWATWLETTFSRLGATGATKSWHVSVL